MFAKLLYRDVQGRDFAVDLTAAGAFLGTGPECLIRTDDPAVQARHCQIAFDGENFFVVDLGARSTFVNERCVERSTLEHDDVIRCGSLQVHFVKLAPVRTPEPPKPGEIFSGRFEIVKFIGQDPPFNIYQARQLSTGRDVAVKVVLNERFRKSGAGHQYLEGARAVAKLRGPHTVSVLDCGYNEDRIPYVVTELAPDPSVADHLHRQGPFSPTRAVAIAMQVCRSLAEAHRHGFMHLELKPGMLFLSDLLEEVDFVKVLYPSRVSPIPVSIMEAPQDLEDGPPMGNPRYLSPEQIRGQPTGPTADLYTVALILHQMLTGHHPFEGNTVYEELEKKFRAEPHHMDRVPAALVPILRQALAVEPTQRQQRVEEFLRQCEQVLSAMS